MIGDVENPVADPRVQAKLEAEVMGALDHLASYEKPKKLGLLAEEFTIENGILTPTQSIKRRIVEERYDALIDSCYEEEAIDEVVLVAS